MKDKIVTPAQAIAIIRSGDTVSVSGFVGIGTPDELLIALEQRFLESRGPAGSAWYSPQRPAIAATVD